MLEILRHNADSFGPLARAMSEIPLWIYAILLFAIVVSTTVHEAAHAWVADRLGDPGPREQGRISLNPMRHFDWLGLAIMGVTLLIGFPIGWGKSLKTDPSKYRCGARKGAAYVGAAGPLANLALAIALSPLVRLVLEGVIPPTPLVVYVFYVLVYTLLISVSQFCFNLLPIHPMDASHVVLGLLPEKLGDAYQNFMQRWGVYLFLVMMFTEIPSKLLFPLPCAGSSGC
ncbi:MAG: site-2 protease family protein [Armatimonas sp.]